MLLTTLFYSGCELLGTMSGKNPNPVLTLSGLNGNITNTFRSGEHFQMEFSLKNTTDQDLSYGYSGVSVVFFYLSGR